MTRFDDVIMLPGLPAPKLLEEYDFTDLRDRQLAEYVRLWPEFEDDTEYEPVRAHFGVDAYVEGLLRQRTNEAAAATRLATASGADLDIIGQSRRRNIQRLVIDPGDPDANPPIAPTYESDSAYRRRIQLGPESYSVAGPEGAYVFWAMAVAAVADATAVSPQPCDALITVMGHEDGGAVDQTVLDAVYASCAADNRRPICDRVTVQSVAVVEFSLALTLRILPGPSAGVVEAEAAYRLAAYLAARRYIGKSLTESALHAAVTVEGVEDVVGVPDGGIVIAEAEVGYCTEATITVEVIDG